MAEIDALLLTCAGCFALTAVSAVVPWVNRTANQVVW